MQRNVFGTHHLEVLVLYTPSSDPHLFVQNNSTVVVLIEVANVMCYESPAVMSTHGHTATYTSFILTRLVFSHLCRTSATASYILICGRGRVYRLT